MRPRFERRGDCVECATTNRDVIVVEVWHIGVAHRGLTVFHMALTTELYGQLVRRRDFQIKRYFVQWDMDGKYNNNSPAI